MKPKKAIVTVIIIGSILFGNLLPIYTLAIQPSQEIVVSNSDSTHVENKPLLLPVNEKEQVEKSKTTTNLTYNFIYFLITKFIEANTIYRSR